MQNSEFRIQKNPWKFALLRIFFVWRCCRGEIPASSAGMTIIFKWGNDNYFFKDGNASFFLDGMTILYYILISQVSLIGQVGQ